MTNVVIRPLHVDDLDAVVALNAGEVQHTSAMDRAQLQTLAALSLDHRVATVDGAPAGMLLALRAGCGHVNDNFAWFSARYARFVYVDRIVIARDHQGLSIGRRLYAQLFDAARADGIAIVCCEYNLVPPNHASRRRQQKGFHAGGADLTIGDAVAPVIPASSPGHAMHPALSVIFFTTLSGAGYGLLAWLGVSLTLLNLRGAGASPVLAKVQLIALFAGLLLSTIGLVCSLMHLGRPFRAWRAFSQWRTSWLSREGVMAVLTVVPTLLTGALLLWAKPGPFTQPMLAVLGVVMALCALLTVACTAMIYASLKPIPAWRHPVVVPVYLVYSLLTGLALLFTLMLSLLGNQGPEMMLITLGVVGALLAAVKWLYWWETDRAGLPVTRGDAIGMPGRTATVFERPHTQASYITREMAFQLARQHGLWLRITATALLVAGPLLAWLLLALGLGNPALALCMASLLLLAGAFVERWLFFAQARHIVTQYY